MGCGACGGGARRASPRAAGAAPQAVIDPTPHKWEVAFPNGATQLFDTEWQATSAARVGGGTQPRKVYT